jgi:hypothetical protein
MYKVLKVITLSAFVFLSGCGLVNDEPSFVIEQFSVTPNPTIAPTADSASTVKFIWRIKSSSGFTAALVFVPESAPDDDLNYATTQAYIDCRGRCQSGTYESVCSVSIVKDQPDLRFLRCDDPTGLVLSPGRYRYRAGGGSDPVGLNNKVAEDRVFGIITIN